MEVRRRDLERNGERGAVLLLALMLTVVFAALSTSLLSTAEMQLRVQSNARDIEKSERAAQSAVEWGAALVKANGLVDTTRSAPLTVGTTITVDVRASGSPQVHGSGTAHGVASRYAASVTREPAPFPHAFVSFAGTSRLDHDLRITGDAYLGGAPPLSTVGAKLRMDGNLLLATETPIGGSIVVHTTGATSYGVAPVVEPAWNTLRFTLGPWSVPVTTFSGGGKVTNRTLVGIVVVNMLGGQQFEFEGCTVTGTIVVPALYPPLLDLLGTPTLVFEKDNEVVGGTAETGNLAILAPTCDVQTRNGRTTIRGVSYVRRLDLTKNFTHDGLLMLRSGIERLDQGTRFLRAESFAPAVPVGIQWTGAAAVRTRWLGKQ